LAQIILNEKHSKSHLKYLKIIFVFLVLFNLISLFAFLSRPFNFFYLSAFIFKFLLGWYLYRSLQTIQYSFWTIFFIITPIVFYDSSLLLRFWHPYLSFSIISLFAIVYTIVALEMKKTVYYPRVNWWDYDFRLRKDIPVRVIFDQNTHVARIVNVQKDAFTLASFEKMGPGLSISLNLIDENKEIEIDKIKFLIASRRTQLFGRPFVYAVQPLFLDSTAQTDQSDKIKWKKFVKVWKNVAPPKKFVPAESDM
jgi:hypothetical protein